MTTKPNELSVSEATRRLNAAGVACTAQSVRNWIKAGTLAGRVIPRPSGRSYIVADAESVDVLIADTLGVHDIDPT